MDAVVGGGGLVQLPALLIAFPAAAPAQILATNKLASICGTTTSSLTYARRIRPSARTVLPLAAAAFAGSAAGAACASLLPAAVLLSSTAAIAAANASRCGLACSIWQL